MRDMKLVAYDEPFARLLTQGMVLNDIYFRKPATGRISYYNPAEIDVQLDDKGNRIGQTLRADGGPVEWGGIGTMSKSKNNGIDPQALIEKYGADTARFFMMMTSPPEQTLEWSDSGVEGSFRFLKRLWTYCARFNAGGAASATEALRKATRFEIHSVLKQANHDIQRQQFNTVASAAMKMLNALERLADVGSPEAAEGLRILLRLLAPITPHVTHHLWRTLGFGSDILAAGWPEPDPAALVQDEIELALQVNGKLRGTIRVPTRAAKEEVEQTALASDAAQRFLDGKPPKRVIVVPGKLVNIVAG
jgi:leucyl-tRNA synthetase